VRVEGTNSVDLGHIGSDLSDQDPTAGSSPSGAGSAGTGGRRGLRRRVAQARRRNAFTCFRPMFGSAKGLGERGGDNKRG
jgi:hypothetical protein